MLSVPAAGASEHVPFEEFCKRAAEAGYQISFAKYQFEVE